MNERLDSPGGSRQWVYAVPIEDRYLLYAPLAPLCFVGNAAMRDAVKHALDRGLAEGELGEFLRSVEFWGPDRLAPRPGPDLLTYRPTQCILMPTTACDLGCTYCYAAGSHGDGSRLPWPLARAAIDQVFANAQALGGSPFSLGFHGGGEPTLHEDLFVAACSHARSLDPTCTISLTTHGCFEDPRREALLDWVDEVSLSLDGGPGTQDRQRPDARGQGTFERVMRTLCALEARDLRYGLRLTVTRQSVDELASNIDLLCRLTACPTFQVEPVYDQGRASCGDQVIREPLRFVAAFLEAERLARARGRALYFSAARPWVVTSAFCQAPSNALIVTARGELTSCYEVFDRTHPLADTFIIGQLDEDRGLRLHPGRREALVEAIAGSRKLCVNCFCFFHCAGDCPPKALLARARGDSFRCEVTRAITREWLLDRIAETEGVWRGHPDPARVVGNG